MDPQRFDAFTRTLATGRSRRHLIRALAGGLAGGAIGLAARSGVGAQTCGVLGDECTSPDDCCAGLTCFEALCDNPSGLCMDADEFCGGEGLECCEGLTCTDDYCAEAAAPSLPDTGVGTAAGGGGRFGPLLGAGLAAGAAVLVAGKRILGRPAPAEE